MSQYILPSVVNGVAVTVGLFVLWSLVGGMKHLPAGTRAGWAGLAGLISAIAAFVITSSIAGGAA